MALCLFAKNHCSETMSVTVAAKSKPVRYSVVLAGYGREFPASTTKVSAARKVGGGNRRRQSVTDRLEELQRRYYYAASDLARLEADDFAHTKGFGPQIQQMRGEAHELRSQIESLGETPINIYDRDAVKELLGLTDD